jgi:hypothetical protein
MSNELRAIQVDAFIQLRICTLEPHDAVFLWVEIFIYVTPQTWAFIIAHRGLRLCCQVHCLLQVLSTLLSLITKITTGNVVAYRMPSLRAPQSAIHYCCITS